MITKRDIAFAASRLFALYCMLQILFSMLGIPMVISAFATVEQLNREAHLNRPLSAPQFPHYAFDSIVTTAVHLLVYTVAAILFWNCGPAIERLFTRESLEE